MRGTWETVEGMGSSSVAGGGVVGIRVAVGSAAVAVGGMGVAVGSAAVAVGGMGVAVGSAAVAVGGIGVAVSAGGANGFWQLTSKSTVTNIPMVDNLIIFILLVVI
jgi:hypothetical protein